jgi:hypothetical protein
MPWIATKGNKTVYHTEEACAKLQQAAGYREVSEGNSVLYNLTECSRCAGETEYDQDTRRRFGWSPAKELRANGGEV